MNVIKVMVAVVTIATIPKEALNAYVTMAMNQIVIEEVVEVSIPKSVNSHIYLDQISTNVMMTMVAVVTIAAILKEALNVHVMMAMNQIVIEEVVKVSIPKSVNSHIYIYLYQISMNVMMTMVAVVTIATTLKEALNVHVTMAMNQIAIGKIVQVKLIF